MLVALPGEAHVQHIGSGTVKESGLYETLQTHNKEVVWHCDNTDVATVNPSNGYIYAKAIGTAKINNDNTLYIISGSLNGELTNNVLATQDGNYWINTINQADTLLYKPVKDACVIDYYNYFYLLGGTTDEGKTPTSYYSRNDGFSWEPLKSYQRPANGFSQKENMAACKLNDYIIIFNCSNTSRLEVWKGRINRADFIIKK